MNQAQNYDSSMYQTNNRSSLGNVTTRNRGEDISGAGISIPALLLGAAIGAAVMYFADPAQGRSRRSWLGQKGKGLGSSTFSNVGRITRDWGNRAKDMISDVSSSVREKTQDVFSGHNQGSASRENYGSDQINLGTGT